MKNHPLVIKAVGYNLCSMYRSYEKFLISTLKRELRRKKLKIDKQCSVSNYSIDIATTEFTIKNPDTGLDATLNCVNMWKEFLFIDREDNPPRIDFAIFDQESGQEKIIKIVSARIEVANAVLQQDQARLQELTEDPSIRLKIHDQSNNERGIT
jgi:hypothetical protein